MTTASMIQRFREVPHQGCEPDPPLEGWRLQRLHDDGTLFLTAADGILRAEQCYQKPETLIPSFQPDSHTPPHPNCECGIRVVGEGEYLARYWSEATRLYKASGLGLRDWWATDQAVITRLRTKGRVTPGHKIPHDDPHTTVRTGQARPLEIYHPEWVNPAQIRHRHPGVSVRSIKELPPSFAVYGGSGLDFLREPEPMKSTLRYQSQGRYIRVVTGAAEVVVPRTHLQPPEVQNAIWGAIDRGHHGSAHAANLATIINRLVIPLTDLTDRAEMQGCAMGLAVGLAALADRRATVGNPTDGH